MSTEPERLDRADAPDLDAVLGKPFKVLDDGFVRPVDYMGTDQSIVQAARISYGAGTRKLHEDKGLIRYLMRHRHTTPFEMCEIKLHVRVPMDCWRQWIRHRTANVNEYSTRYSEAIDAVQKTTPDEWRQQSSSNKQGSEKPLDAETGSYLSSREDELLQFSREVYAERLDKGVSREQARKDLPLSTYTEAYWKIDLHNLFHFLALRMDAHAQLEIRTYANVIGNEIVRRWCPVAWEAFQDYQLNSLSLSRIEIQIISAMQQDRIDEALKIAESCGWLEQTTQQPLKSNREREECERKLGSLGLHVPWAAAQ